MLLSNIYSSQGQYDKSDNVINKMKMVEIKKERPGMSWITINGVSHEFVVYDKKHSKLNLKIIIIEAYNYIIKINRY